MYELDNLRIFLFDKNLIFRMMGRTVKMKYIEQMHIEGLKKFRELDITFNPYMNIVVGENEAGKGPSI